ncbi:MAG TPA: glycosyltransferase family 2 protein [Terriglobales bacterium]|nr:glycosyltransferase family 2 protein [Terriglobales bacterium]
MTPRFSVIIAVYNDWTLLNGCLESLGHEANAPTFEVIVVDDGSKEPAPEIIEHWAQHYPLTILREPHKGIPSARNRGIRASKGSILVFVDADCRFKSDCLTALDSIASSSPHDCFQLHLVGDCTNLLGRAEELRLVVFQKQILQPDGCVRYLNTAGFAIRREKVDVENGLFDPSLLRGEDTLLLANLIQRGQLPFFASNATIQHVVPLSLIGSIRKDLRSAYLERASYDRISSLGVRVRVQNRERFKMLLEMWKVSKSKELRRSAWFAVVIRQLFRRIFAVFFRLFGVHPQSDVSVNSAELVGK